MDNPVSFKLFSFTDYPNHAVMSIRGSEYMFDWIVNAQLWSCALLAQMVSMFCFCYCFLQYD